MNQIDGDIRIHSEFFRLERSFFKDIAPTDNRPVLIGNAPAEEDAEHEVVSADSSKRLNLIGPWEPNETYRISRSRGRVDYEGMDL